ncbi:endonuclease-reverse transcriptase [Plakobranchus ocellatus]|uniref:Endonuclease-reverse transcriptase n=1 Tax=Plakobranchus ocellatus TaxID=259542 RepID=A0AAV4AU48_9GAST|nr:endonuclease-reverse transcriptase [Plakobranchus ocellatus]
MKNGKATGPDNIAAEQIKALDEFGINKITELLDEIYETGEIPKEMLKSIFIALPKKYGATECELHRTISLMSQVTKILLRIAMMRVRNKIRPKIGDTQCGFVEGKGTTNAVYMLRMIIERALEMQKDIYLCFIDYTKAFDRVKHWEMIKQLKQLHVDGKDLRIIKNIYWQQIAAVRIENEISPFQMIKRGVRQGCVLSPDLFNLYSETILRNLDEYPGIRIGGRMINNLRYADDTVLIAENKEDLQKLIDIAATKSKRMGLELNSKKTEVMVINRRPNLNADLFVDGTKLKQRDYFKYLGTIITQDGKSHTEIKARIAQAKTYFQKKKPLLTNNKITITTRKRALQCYIEPILMYRCEAWTITKEIQKKIEAAEICFFRRMLRVPWTARKTNEEVPKETESTRSLMSRIRRRQAKFVGHIMRREGLENLVTTGRMEGKKSRGRQREKMLDGMTSWMGTKRVTDALSESWDRESWKDMIANAKGQGT